MRVYPEHLLNQELTVVSGGLSVDGYGESTYSEVVVSSGSGRLEFVDVRTTTPAGTDITQQIRCWVKPSLEIATGHLVEIESTKYRVGSIERFYDGKGTLRLKGLVLSEVAE